MNIAFVGQCFLIADKQTDEGVKGPPIAFLHLGGCVAGIVRDCTPNLHGTNEPFEKKMTEMKMTEMKMTEMTEFIVVIGNKKYSFVRRPFGACLSAITPMRRK